MIRRTLALLTLTASTLAAQSPPVAVAADYRAEIEAWRAERVARLTSETGWLTLTGLFPLDEGSYVVGSAETADIDLPPGAPPRLGTLRVGTDAVTFEAAPDAAVTVDGEALGGSAAALDNNGEPALFEAGSINFFVIRRGDVLLLRVRDREHPDRHRFAGIESFPIDPSFRFAARFEPYEPVKQVPVANIIGLVSDSPSWGAVVFERGGETYRIDALAEPGDEELFLIFGDATSGKETYGAGRYLYVDAPDAEGRIDLDFNRAYNPPCAFTRFATCPLPPRQNRLALRIAAGEKDYRADGH